MLRFLGYSFVGEKVEPRVTQTWFSSWGSLGVLPSLSRFISGKTWLTVVPTSGGPG